MTEWIYIPLKKASDIDVSKPLLNAFKSIYSGTSGQKDYSDIVESFSKLRKNALWKAFEKSESALEILYRYYDQVCVLEKKIPSHELQIPFKWKNAFGGKQSLTVLGLGYEKVCVLFNIAALQSMIAVSQPLDNDEGLKLSAKLLQLAAGILNSFKGSVMSIIDSEPTPDLRPETLEALASLMLAQANEIFTFKAIHDNMKDTIIAKLAAQTEEFYFNTLKLMQKEIFRAFWDKDWIHLITAKQLGYKGLAEFTQSKVCKKNNKIGEEIARLKVAIELFNSALHESSKLRFFEDNRDKASRRLTEVQKDNDFIYHERIPDAKELSPIDKVAIAKPSPVPEKFSSDFLDIFQELLPSTVYQAINNFESAKRDLVSSEVAKLRNARQLLNGTLASLNLPAAIEDVSGTEIPQSVKEKAVAIRNAGGIEFLEKMMNELPDLLQRNDDILNEAERMLNDEQSSDDHLRTQFKERWTRLPSTRLTQQFRLNSQKYRGIINNAKNADKVIKEKYNEHREPISLLCMAPDTLAHHIPTGAAVTESGAVNELRSLMESVATLKAEQDAIENELQSKNIDSQSIFTQALVNGELENESSLVVGTLDKYYSSLKEQVARSLQKQENLIKSIQIKHGEFSREQQNSGSTREMMLCKLAGAYDVFIELKGNLQEGIKFYNDLTQLLIIFQSKISDYCFARKTEKEELLKDLTHNLSVDNQVPDETAGMQRMTLSRPTTGGQQLPYPTSNQGGMPVPHGSFPPLPSTYNPYS
ncbi:hypothetical protein TKK_0015193 [Trichogramma kaykai]|uniref:BRO1 domain-containing protein n=1 Tax=Trichogramma kaykai TaxID=54128 RepID=A0ABD2WBS9_9HYME